MWRVVRFTQGGYKYLRGGEIYAGEGDNYAGDIYLATCHMCIAFRQPALRHHTQFITVHSSSQVHSSSPSQPFPHAQLFPTPHTREYSVIYIALYTDTFLLILHTPTSGPLAFYSTKHLTKCCFLLVPVRLFHLSHVVQTLLYSSVCRSELQRCLEIS